MIAFVVPPKILFSPLNPGIVVTQRVSAECGCSVFIGKRFDNFEVSTIASACSPEHDTLVRRFNDLLLWSLADGGTDRPLADVVDELLAEARVEVAA